VRYLNRTYRLLPTGLAAELAERGVKVDYRSVWEFAHREGLSFKKNRRGGGADQA
jgi:transposase